MDTKIGYTVIFELMNKWGEFRVNKRFKSFVNVNVLEIFSKDILS